MKIEKIFLDEIYRCYSTMAMELDGELHYFFASEEKGHPCYAYPHHDLKNRKVVWEQGGGTMSMIPLPNTKNQFIAIMDFYLKECPSQSKLVWFTYKEGAFIQKDLFYLPFLHRFDLYQVQDDVYFIGATIAHDKKDKEDWSLPGKIYTAKLPQDLNQTQDIKLEVLVDGLFRNHGYTRATEQDGGYFGSDEGITRVTIPQKASGAWQVERIMSGQIGEIAVGDVNHDGKEEIMTIDRSMVRQSRFMSIKMKTMNMSLLIHVKLISPILWSVPKSMAYKVSSVASVVSILIYSSFNTKTMSIKPCLWMKAVVQPT